jgi:hypothetical protein
VTSPVTDAEFVKKPALVLVKTGGGSDTDQDVTAAVLNAGLNIVGLSPSQAQNFTTFGAHVAQASGAPVGALKLDFTSSVLTSAGAFTQTLLPLIRAGNPLATSLWIVVVDDASRSFAIQGYSVVSTFTTFGDM